MKKILLLIASYFFCHTVYADGWFVEGGLGLAAAHSFGSRQELRSDNNAAIDNALKTYNGGVYELPPENPMGLVMLGYKYNNWQTYYLHISSIIDPNDLGLDMLVYSHRWEFR